MTCSIPVRKRQITNKKTVASTPCGEKETLTQNLIRFSEYFEPKSNSLLYNTIIQVGVVMKGLLSKMMTDILTVYFWTEVNSRIICIELRSTRRRTLSDLDLQSSWRQWVGPSASWLVTFVSDDGFYSHSRKDNFLLILILTLLKEPSPWSFYCQFLYFSQYQPLILYCYISA